MADRGSRQKPLNVRPGMENGGFATYPSLRGKAVVVTGGGSGIGAVIVEHFARQGARVGFLDVADDASTALVRSLADAPQAPLYVRCDVTDITALRAALTSLESALGSVTTLVNNAASDDRHATAEITPEYWDERMAVNLRHVFFASQAVTNGMIAAGGGSIINIGSIAWLIPSTNQAAYVTAKAGLTGLTRTLARELGPANIRVNCVLPGAIMTDRQRRLWVTPAYAAEIEAAQSIKRELLPADIARFVLFLAADDSSAMTSQSYIVDGGWI
jgi:NAD(P)-dependent dehydrogenase (short-subunit alcohol dehydrogenase family)